MAEGTSGRVILPGQEVPSIRLSLLFVIFSALPSDSVLVCTREGHRHLYNITLLESAALAKNRSCCKTCVSLSLIHISDRGGE